MKMIESEKEEVIKILRKYERIGDEPKAVMEMAYDIRAKNLAIDFLQKRLDEADDRVREVENDLRETLIGRNIWVKEVFDVKQKIEKLQAANKILSECVLRIQKVMDVKTYNNLDIRIQNHLNEAKQKAEEVMK